MVPPLFWNTGYATGCDHGFRSEGTLFDAPLERKPCCGSHAVFMIAIVEIKEELFLANERKEFMIIIAVTSAANDEDDEQYQ